MPSDGAGLGLHQRRGRLLARSSAPRRVRDRGLAAAGHRRAAEVPDRLVQEQQRRLQPLDDRLALGVLAVVRGDVADGAVDEATAGLRRRGRARRRATRCGCGRRRTGHAGAAARRRPRRRPAGQTPRSRRRGNRSARAGGGMSDPACRARKMRSAAALASRIGAAARRAGAEEARPGARRHLAKPPQAVLAPGTAALAAATRPTSLASRMNPRFRRRRCG